MQVSGGDGHFIVSWGLWRPRAGLVTGLPQTSRLLRGSVCGSPRLFPSKDENWENSIFLSPFLPFFSKILAQ